MILLCINWWYYGHRFEICHQSFSGENRHWLWLQKLLSTTKLVGNTRWMSSHMPGLCELMLYEAVSCVYWLWRRAGNTPRKCTGQSHGSDSWQLQKPPTGENGLWQTACSLCKEAVMIEIVRVRQVMWQEPKSTNKHQSLLSELKWIFKTLP